MASGTVDRVNAERFRLLPMTASADPNGRRVADPDRPIVEGVGIYEVEPLEFGIEFGARRVGKASNDLVTLSTGAKPTLSINRTLFVTGAGPRQGDLVQLVDRLGESESVVTDIQFDGQTRLQLTLAY